MSNNLHPIQRWLAFLDACFEKSWFSRVALGMGLLSMVLVFTGLWLRHGLMLDRAIYQPFLFVGMTLPYAAVVLAIRAALEPEPRRLLSLNAVALNGLLIVTWQLGSGRWF